METTLTEETCVEILEKVDSLNLPFDPKKNDTSNKRKSCCEPTNCSFVQLTPIKRSKTIFSSLASPSDDFVAEMWSDQKMLVEDLGEGFEVTDEHESLILTNDIIASLLDDFRPASE